MNSIKIANILQSIVLFLTMNVSSLNSMLVEQFLLKYPSEVPGSINFLRKFFFNSAGLNEVVFFHDRIFLTANRNLISRN